MQIAMNLGADSYDILVERGALHHLSEYCKLNRKVLIVTDSGVPAEYAETAAKQAEAASILVIPQGEEHKNFDSFRAVLQKLVEENFTRSDCVMAVGGGVVGDLAGFAASCYMRGIDFYNVPTTLLSQIDSSIGGKTAIDFEGYKNIVGAFYQPKQVVIDPDVLQTLPPRQISSGLAEAVKMALTSDRALFEWMEGADLQENLDEIIVRSLRIKKSVVEQDEKEAGLRMVLNFGHTLGHGIETEQNGRLFHGECVALGMLPMCSEPVRQRLLAVMKKAGLPEQVRFCKEKAFEAVQHDKKFRGQKVTVVKVPEPGRFVMEKAGPEELWELLGTLEGAR